MNEEMSRNKVVDDDLSDVDISEFKRIVHNHTRNL